jgi:hypothetical protein
MSKHFPLSTTDVLPNASMTAVEGRVVVLVMINVKLRQQMGHETTKRADIKTQRTITRNEKQLFKNTNSHP